MRVLGGREDYMTRLGGVLLGKLGWPTWRGLGSIRQESVWRGEIMGNQY